MAMELRNLARNFPSQLDMKFIKLLASQLDPLSKLYTMFYPDQKKQITTAATSTEAVFKAVFEEFFPDDKATDLKAVIDTYDFLLQNIPPGQKKPAIVIDEVNALILWKRKDAVALKQLLDFIKRSCKEEHLAHVILATSEVFLVSWLESQGFEENVRDDQVLGDLTSAEAFVYLCGGKVLNRNGVVEAWPGLIAQSKETKKLGMTPEDWKKVWSVCGGNIQLLKVCVGYAKQSKSWEEGVAKVLLKPSMAVTKALEYPELIDPPVGSGGPRLWEAKHYKSVLRLIAASPYYAVRRKEVHAALKDIPENVTAAQVLLSMVEFNVLSLRPYTEMAKDIPREAFFKKVGRKEKQDNVVTMPSPAHLAAVLELDVELEEEQEELESVEAVEDNSQANS
ncbi:hypothetical protein NADE_007528 [Nannochloris sp. 'desiccata']|nr:hypothetical protein NADE_007469 [Chlorella desiccata (nom. nud.)]KAH7615735.1 hypothetical protein NADE_007528 [Chlorella desiccata (nom. nud.)]